MKREEKFGLYLRKLREKKNYSINQLGLYSSVSAAQISRIENGKRGIPKADTIKKLAKVLNTPYEEMMVEAGYSSNMEVDHFALTEKEERDIQKDLQKIIDNLESDNGYAAFDGQSIEDMDAEDKELLIASLENSLRLAKRMAKEKFTPKKYKK